jgi:aminoglycoside phosphotransferase (APT) family kinase protein
MDTKSRLTTWVEAQLPDARDVRLHGLDRVEFGHSAETLLTTICWSDDAGDHQKDVVARLRPPAPGLLEPYDLRRQFDILRGLVHTPVRAPAPLWFEPSGDVLGREFYLMERLAGTVYEMGSSEEPPEDPDLIRRMCESMIDQLAAIHLVDLDETGLEAIGDGSHYLEHEISHWSDEIQRVQRGPLPALERLLKELQDQLPEPCPSVTLVHGDAKSGNYAFQDGEVSAVFDWELATVGDPLADVGWAELLWLTPGSFTATNGALSADEFVALWEERTGIESQHRAWYRAFQTLKIAAISLVASHLVDAGHSDDLRFVHMAYGIRPATTAALRDLGVEADLPPGPVLPRKERREQVKAAQLP